MNTYPVDWVSLATIFKDLISENIWPVVAIVFLYFARDGIGQFVKRLVNLDFSWGKAKGSIRAEPLTPQIETETKNLVEQETPSETKANSITPIEAKESWLTLLRNGQKDEAKRVFEEYLARIDNDSERVRMKSIYLYYSYKLAGDKASLEKLQNLFKEAEEFEQLEEIAEWLSFSYRDAKNIKAERQIWERLLTLELPEGKIAYFIMKLAGCLEAENKIDEACSLVEANLKKLSDDKALGILFNKLGSLYKENGNKLLAAVAYEKALQLLPDDNDILFSAAYAQSNSDFPYLSYYNYDTLINLFPDTDVAYNNLGVQAAKLGMPGISVQFYKSAIEKNNTLAMSNIAYLYMAKGFYVEADAILKKALEDKDPNPNVSTALSELEKKKQDEQVAKKKTMDKAVEQREFLRLFSEARFLASVDICERSEKWCINGNKIIELKQISEKIVASWEQVVGVLATTPRKYSIDASTANRALTGIYRSESSSRESLIGYEAPKTRNFIAYHTSDLNELNIMFLDKEEPMFMTWVKAASQTECPT